MRPCIIQADLTQELITDPVKRDQVLRFARRSLDLLAKLGYVIVDSSREQILGDTPNIV